MNKVFGCFTALIMAFILVAMSVAAVLPATAVGATVSDGDYRAYLRGLGFPESYVESLYELHLLHPSWSFEPLPVTELNSKYTWSYCIKMETEDNPKRSLVSRSDAFAAYRHATNTTLYDTGWYQASTAAVEYFMDPRNFLNEKDIFQFEDLSFDDIATVPQVEDALAGTFMADAVLENGKTYAEYFYEVGRELNVSPIHLASRARMEQGKAGTAAQISGLGGDKLWYYYSNGIRTENGGIVNSPSTGHTEAELKGYNGLYNFFNVNAAGTGRFAVLLGSLKAAREGTAAMAEQWGGSPSWDTRWKSIYGGAYKLSSSYINNYQNTLYLQKWNVDNRSKTASGSSRNFWGQWAQNIGAALSEARNCYVSLAAGDCLDCAFNFIIPVYSGMPESCPDPARGSCEMYAVSTTKYHCYNRLSMYTGAAVTDTYVRSATISVAAGGSTTLSGVSLHSCRPEAFEYSVDGGEWVAMEGTHDASLTITDGRFSVCRADDVPTRFSAVLTSAGLSLGEHTVAVRGRAGFAAEDTSANSCRYYLVAEIPLSVVEQRGAVITLKGSDGGERRETVTPGSIWTLPDAPSTAPECDESGMKNYFAGWVISVDTTEPAGGTEQLMPAGASLTVARDITVEPLYVCLGMRYGASAKISEVSALRFNGIVGFDGYERLRELSAGRVSCGLIICRVPANGLTVITPDELAGRSIIYKQTVAVDWRQTASRGGYYSFSGDTDAIGADNYGLMYAATCYVKVTYANSATAYICADYSAARSCRSVSQVWAAAAAVGAPRYSAEEMEIMG